MGESRRRGTKEERITHAIARDKREAKETLERYEEAKSVIKNYEFKTKSGAISNSLYLRLSIAAALSTIIIGK